MSKAGVSTSAIIGANLYQRVIESLSDHAVFAVSPDGMVISWNVGATQTFGYTPDDILGCHFSAVFTTADVAAGIPRIELDQALHGRTTNPDRRLVRKDGTEFWGTNTVQPIYGGAKKLIGFTKLVRDVTQIHEALEAQHDSEERFRLLVESVHDYAIFSTDAVLHVTTWNAGAQHLFGYTEADIVGADVALLATAEDRAQGIPAYEMQAALSTGQCSYERWLIRKDGTRFLARGKVGPMTSALGDQAVRGFVTIAHDITEDARVADDLLRRALYDHLTDLPNRRLFHDHVQRAIALRKRHALTLFAVLFIDLDHFKSINDDLGHVSADAVLVRTARLLEECVRSGDVVARLGGDEFAVLLNGINGLADAKDAAERIVLAMRKPFTIGAQTITLSASIGIALSKADHRAPEDLLRDADKAMYSAKLGGRARMAVFGETRTVALRMPPSLLTELSDAIDSDGLRLAYQPIVSLPDYHVVGFEALVRWQHPTRGLLPPAAFIPQAEATDLIIRLDRWVLRQGCMQLKRWQTASARRANLHLNVNMSAKQFSHPDLLVCLQEALTDSTVAAGSLRLEITETAVMQKSAQTASLIAAVRALGIHVHLDDFGTGFCSLTSVQDLLVDALKIDRAFIAKVDVPSGYRLVAMIADVAKTFGLTAIAEGVETLEQLTCVEDVGCDAAQGFLFSEPLDADEVASYLMLS